MHISIASSVFNRCKAQIAGILFLLVFSLSSVANEGPIEAAASLKLRSIGPAVMGGRIADIAVDPTNKHTWYIAVGSGGLWKTQNAGTTFTPVFDNEASYSIGTVAIDPNNSNVIWVGSGENVSGRHVAWGDGVYKSVDGGKSWRNMGLKQSEHIGRILIDPEDSNTVYVAAEGPLWAAGGERGVFKTTDGGSTWTQVLKIDKNTGVTDLEFHPQNSQQIYAAAYQRRRAVWSFLAGGPASGIYKSVDGGQSWSQKTSGLPSGDMGKIGLAVTPADPNRLYATIEADAASKGFYISHDQGESWSKQSSYVSGGTGPHYYQEIEASPSQADLVYQMDVFLHRTNNAGKKFEIVGTGREKHSDNHAMWIDPDNNNHFLIGSDGGLYETFDQGKTYRHFANLPISQFYKVAVDNADPFYNILGGTQDLGTLYGPSRTTHYEGVRNSDWYVPLGADGYGVAFHPERDDIMYMMWQQGTLVRNHKKLEQWTLIKPEGNPDEAPERWNWDSPLALSEHNPDRIYYGSQRIWQSDDRGQSWRPISGDLTRNENRYSLKMMDERVWSVDALYDVGAMSKYNTTTSISESPVQQGVIYVGTDDGYFQATQDGGKNWKRTSKVGKLPKRAFFNDVEASLFDAGTVFAVASNHKEGDFTPYIMESKNYGKSWKSIAGDLPEGVIVWAIEQDHVNKNVLFIGAENGLYFTLNRGKNWHKFNSAPTIAFRDLKLQRRDNDLVGASFGRGIYILDDYTPIRALAENRSDSDARLFPVRDAWWYVPSVPGQAKGQPTLGSTGFKGINPEHGVTFTYYLAKDFSSLEDQRREKEKALREKGKDVPFPGFDRLKQERLEQPTNAMVLIKDTEGKPIRWVKAKAKKGMHRVTWDMRKPAPDAITFDKPAFQPPWVSDPEGPLAAPGQYTAQLMLMKEGKLTAAGGAQSFTIKPLPLDNETDHMQVVAFQDKTAELSREITRAMESSRQVKHRLKHMEEALLRAPAASPQLFAEIQTIKTELAEIEVAFTGDEDRYNLDTSTHTPMMWRVGLLRFTHWQTTAMPSEMMRKNLQFAEEAFSKVKGRLNYIVEQDLPKLDKALVEAGAPSSL